MRGVNLFRLQALIVQSGPLRFTPAGLPALDLLLEHQSNQLEAGVHRQCLLRLKAIAFGTIAEQLATQALGGRWMFEGFLSSPRSLKGVTFHIQKFRQD
ncbi:primosomal replication protein N [Limnohabitans sp.]|uniref:primosomal replication protein N n=1 Tax=Limnohabitans sp. TaxID=1907725 RepID=UPI00391A97C0